jgi:hypothetical protein
MYLMIILDEIELVPKNTSGWSLITYLSYPPGNSVNDFIDEKLTTVQYSKFDNVIYIIQTLNEHVNNHCTNVERCSNVEHDIEHPMGIHLSI